MFDQILISTNFFDTKCTQFNLSEDKIFNSQFLTQYHGKFKGQPFRTYVGKRYKGGYSDHFPVYIEFKEAVLKIKYFSDKNSISSINLKFPVKILTKTYLRYSNSQI